MKLLLIFCLVFVVFGTETKVHKFLAERNVICGKCKEVVVAYTRGVVSTQEQDIYDLCKDATNKIYTPVCNKIVENSRLVRKLSKFTSSRLICQQLKMCPNENDNLLEKRYAKISAINLTLIDEINKNNKIKWIAGVNKRFKGMSLGDVRKLLGSVVDPKYRFHLPVQTYTQKIHSPSSFDVRTKWPSCAVVSGHIRDQSACGSCWAFGSTEAWNDRLCISKNGDFTQLLSPEETNSCCPDGNGCGGGDPTGAWNWFTSNGVVSGGDYPDIGKNDTCLPYTLPPCAHHVQSKDYPPCPSSEYPTPSCRSSCSNTKYPVSFSNDNHVASTSYNLNSISDMENDIATYGSATAAFTVYEDFLSYKSGVYQHTSGQELGGHAIKFLGWGVESGLNYWLVANSWNDEWGDHGLFKILKGADECGIEDDVSAGRA